MNISFFKKHLRFSGPGGILPVSDEDQVCHRLAMLVLGQCEGKGATQAAKQFHLSRQRYYQSLAAFEQEGALGLVLQPRGPKTDYRRTEQIVRLVIRHRFLDAEASAQVIAQKLQQEGHTVSQRSVERIIADYGLQKKLYALNPAQPAQYLQAQRTRCQQRTSPADPITLERQVRQLLADKISGNQWASGCCSQSICAWEPGICCWAGAASRPNAWNPAWACTWPMSRPSVCVPIGIGVPSLKKDSRWPTACPLFLPIKPYMLCWTAIR
jgi:transposase